jgi:hypothetical protein
MADLIFRSVSGPASLQSLNEICRRPGGSGGNRTRTKFYSGVTFAK